MDAYRSSELPVRVLTALADPTRRRAFELIVTRPMAVGELASQLPVTRPAVSQHLKVLKEARLVAEDRAGTRRVYSATPEGLESLRDYAERMWTVALDRFEEVANERGRRSKGRSRDRKGGRRG